MRLTPPTHPPTLLTLSLAALTLSACGESMYGNDYMTGYPEADYAEPAPLSPDAETPEPDHPTFEENPFIDASQESTSTFSVDVNTASYTYARAQLGYGRLPEPRYVRIEEFINFFRFDYPEPIEDERFSINMEIAPSVFAPDDAESERHLLRIGLRAADIGIEDMKPSNIVFLVDISDSMSGDNRLPLARRAMHHMLEHLRPQDSVAIHTYASGSNTILQPTAGDEKSTIARAIDSMQAGGATNGEAGLVNAYNLAESAF